MGKGKGQRHKRAATKKTEKVAVAQSANPPPPAAATRNRWQLLASRSPSLSPSSSTPSPSRAHRRAAVSKQHRRNFDKFLEFLHNPQNWLLPAAREFLRTKGFGTEYGRANETCLLFSESFPESMQWLKDTTKYNDLVRHVKVFQRGKIYVVTPTARGRHLFVTFMALMSENHSNNVSFGGDFNIEDILIIKHKKSPNEIMKILKDAVKAKDTHQAMVIDLHRAVEIFIPLYEDSDGGLPVYFERFKNDMEGADKNLIANKWFRKYLRYHVAIMPSSGRRSFELSLHSACVNCRATLWGLEMVDICSADWKSVVNPEPGKQKGVSITALNGVYLHNVPNAVPKIHPYDDTLSVFIRFLRNFLEHGGQHENILNDIEELEVCLAMNFSDFLPNLARTLLPQEKMAHFGQAWPSFKLTRWAKS